MCTVLLAYVVVSRAREGRERERDRLDLLSSHSSVVVVVVVVSGYK
jgi:hypothetical protein